LQSEESFRTLLVGRAGALAVLLSILYVADTPDLVLARLCCTRNQPYSLPNTFSIAFNGGEAEAGNRKIFYPGSQASSTEDPDHDG
jgi:hypothetical protein